MMVLGEFYTFYEKIPQAQKGQKAHRQIKIKTVLNAHKKTSKRKKVTCLAQKAQNAHKQIKRQHFYAHKTSKKKRLTSCAHKNI